jgi:hypothetical protein
MHGNLGAPDRRSIAVGALVGAAATIALTVVGSPWTEMVVVSGAAASVPAGAVAAHGSREGMQPFREGAFAALAGVAVGVAASMTVVAVVFPAHPFDVALLLVPSGVIGLLFAFPLSFAVGGVAGYAAGMYWR